MLSSVDRSVDTLGKILSETRNRTEANLKIASLNRQFIGMGFQFGNTGVKSADMG